MQMALKFYVQVTSIHMDATSIFLYGHVEVGA